MGFLDAIFHKNAFEMLADFPPALRSKMKVEPVEGPLWLIDATGAPRQFGDGCMLLTGPSKKSVIVGLGELKAGVRRGPVETALRPIGRPCSGRQGDVLRSKFGRRGATSMTRSACRREISRSRTKPSRSATADLRVRTARRRNRRRGRRVQGNGQRGDGGPPRDVEGPVALHRQEQRGLRRRSLERGRRDSEEGGPYLGSLTLREHVPSTGQVHSAFPVRASQKSEGLRTERRLGFRRCVGRVLVD